MVKIRTPLFSFSAFGNLSKSIIYTASKGVNIVKKFYQSKDNPTIRRLQIRDTYKNGKDAWNSLSEEEQEQYNVRAKGKKMNGFNLFMKEYLKGNIPTSNNALYDVGLYDLSFYWLD